MLSTPELPAAHSPNAVPERRLDPAAMIASRKVHFPSFAVLSALLLTTMLAAYTGVTCTALPISATSKEIMVNRLKVDLIWGLMILFLPDTFDLAVLDKHYPLL